MQCCAFRDASVATHRYASRSRPLGSPAYTAALNFSSRPWSNIRLGHRTTVRDPLSVRSRVRTTPRSRTRATARTSASLGPPARRLAPPARFRSRVGIWGASGAAPGRGSALRVTGVAPRSATTRLVRWDAPCPPPGTRQVLFAAPGELPRPCRLLCAYGATSIVAIMPLSSCERMWQ
jgi:hypothetical protein